jgi:uncharacterized membrane protein
MFEIPLQLLIIGITMIGLDAVWLTLNAATNRSVFAAIQGRPMEIRWIPAILVYVLMIASTWLFAVWKTPSWKIAAAKGAALGLALYGLYDLTNYATLIKYPFDYALRDIAWGTFLIGTSALLAAVITPFIFTTQIESQQGGGPATSRF